MEYQVYLEDNKLQLGYVIWMDPVLGRLSDEVLLTTPCGTVSCCGMPSGAYEIVKPGKLDNECVIVILEERFCFQSGCKYRFQMPLGLFLRPVSAFTYAEYVA